MWSMDEKNEQNIKEVSSSSKFSFGVESIYSFKVLFEFFIWVIFVN
jgi:hypothetical protein